LSLLLDSLRGEAAGLCNSQREMEGSVTDEAQRRRRAEETVAALQAKIEVGTQLRVRGSAKERAETGGYVQPSRA
jgi:hypothetical protein